MAKPFINSVIVNKTIEPLVRFDENVGILGKPKKTLICLAFLEPQTIQLAAGNLGKGVKTGIKFALKEIYPIGWEDENKEATVYGLATSKELY
jgi:hypothetical protein